jgi:HK97 family phage major capsid protein
MTTVAAWAGNLVDQTNLASEFLEFLRPQTIIGRIPNLRRVPFNIRITGQTTGAVAGWVGEAKGKPVTSFSTNAQTLLYTKIAAIAVITQELARFSSPSAEALVRDELARAVIERMDIDFIDPAQAAVAAVNPASITNGVTPLTSAGTSADNIRTDIQNLLEQFVLNNMNATNVVLIMPNTLALAASLLVNSLGQPEFPGLTMNGGTLAGLTVITSQYAANQSGSGNLVIALDPTAILLADDGRVDLSTSMEASIEMSDAPTNASGAVPVPTTLVSMYQTNSIAIKAERFINWLKARTTAVSFIDDVNWGSIGSPS